MTEAKFFTKLMRSFLINHVIIESMSHRLNFSLINNWTEKKSHEWRHKIYRENFLIPQNHRKCGKDAVRINLMHLYHTTCIAMAFQSVKKILFTISLWFYAMNLHSCFLSVTDSFSTIVLKNKYPNAQDFTHNWLILMSEALSFLSYEMACITKGFSYLFRNPGYMADKTHSRWLFPFFPHCETLSWVWCLITINCLYRYNFDMNLLNILKVVPILGYTNIYLCEWVPIFRVSLSVCWRCRPAGWEGGVALHCDCSE